MFCLYIRDVWRNERENVDVELIGCCKTLQTITRRHCATVLWQKSFICRGRLKNIVWTMCPTWNQWCLFVGIHNITFFKVRITWLVQHFHLKYNAGQQQCEPKSYVPPICKYSFQAFKLFFSVATNRISTRPPLTFCIQLRRCLSITILFHRHITYWIDDD